MRARLLTLAVLLSAATAQDITIGVVGAEPERAAMLAAAVDAAQNMSGPPAPTAPVEPREPLAVPVHVCDQAESGVAVGVGGGAGAAAAARVGLALLLADAATSDEQRLAALDLFPHADVLAEACAALCKAKEWRQAVLLHEGSASPAPLLAPLADELVLRARQLPPPGDDDALRNLLLVLKKSGARNFIVWSGAVTAVRVLDAAQRVGLLAERHSYLLPVLDLHTETLADFSYGGANITALRLFDPESKEVRQAMTTWRAAYVERLGDAAEAQVEQIDQVVTNPPSELVLVQDVAKLMFNAAKLLRLPSLPAGDCARGRAAFHADTLLNYVRSEEDGGAGGGLAWAAGGARRTVRLHAAELARGGRLETVARWGLDAGLAWNARPPPPPLSGDVMTNRTFVILIAMNQPYVMRQLSPNRLAGNDRYEGFCIELIERLSQLLHFNYTFIEQPDGAYGTRNKTTGEWNGMMRRLMDDPGIDFAITDLSITAEREEVVDFTTPFMNLGISIMFSKPQPPEPALFAFLLPFSRGVWVGLALAYVGTSLVLFAVGRLCPEEWQNPYPCVEEPPALENQFTLGNALWFNLGAVLLQGSEIAPVAYGTRAVASVWWLFALVITSSYTANLATLLATKTSTEIIHNVRELAENDLGIEYGAKKDGSTYTFFEMSNNPLYKGMFEKMKDQKMPVSNQEGIDRVVEGNYAFLAESTTIEYTVERNCEVVMVGDQLDSKGYGIAMKKNSVYRQALNLALLNLQEAGVLRNMKQSWWKEKHGGGACQKSEERESEEMSMRNFRGLFYVLIVGCGIGVVISTCDLAWAAWRHPRDPERPFGARFWAELRFVFRFDRSVKPVRGPLLTPTPTASARSTARSATAPESGSRRSPSPRPSARSPSASLRSRSARRSSMHAASARLARHASHPRESLRDGY
ncbi:glutamate receptor ionotropic, kainate 2-like [Aricia agestis]|uniref:glutamate receptor ionotropic, kainate 2-like n=1 Tax=Aricia agestis TaxID=91739 RepID=UPI001C2061CA|nr:glutamate receptor ionotropic, kainate 2-like [Aricia agestis]